MKKSFFKIFAVLLMISPLPACQNNALTATGAQVETLDSLTGMWEGSAERSRVVRSLQKTGESTYHFIQVDIPHAGSAVINSEGDITFTDATASVEIKIGPALGSYKALYELGKNTLKETVTESTIEAIPVGSILTYKRI